MVEKISLRIEKFGVGIPGCFVKSEIISEFRSELSISFFLVDPCRYSIERRTRVSWRLVSSGVLYACVCLCLS